MKPVEKLYLSTILSKRRVGLSHNPMDEKIDENRYLCPSLDC
jgi:hypothetical protein